MVLMSVLPQFFPDTWILLPDTVRTTRDTTANKRESSLSVCRCNRAFCFYLEAVESFEIIETKDLPEVVPDVTSTRRLCAGLLLRLVYA